MSQRERVDFLLVEINPAPQDVADLLRVEPPEHVFRIGVVLRGIPCRVKRQENGLQPWEGRATGRVAAQAATKANVT